MRKLFVIGLTAFMVSTGMLVTPGPSYAEDNVAVATVKENPGKSAGVAGCGIAIAFFPPAALICGATIVAGAVPPGSWMGAGSGIDISSSIPNASLRA